MNPSVEISRMLDGKVVADAIDTDCGIPYCFFLSTYLRECFDSYSSMEAAAHATLFGIQHYEKKGVDVLERVKTGLFFTSDEYDDFIYICKYKKEKAKQLTAEKVVSFEQLSSKQIDNLIHETSQSEDRVAENTYKGRLSYFKRYITYLYKLWHQAGNTPKDVVARFENFEETISTDIRRTKSTNKVVRDPFEQAISTDVYFNMLEIIQPFCAKNPFTPSVRLRNQLIVLILNETPIRLGALCKLKISDLRVDDGAPRFHVTRTPNDPHDRRKRPAAQKTNAHIGSLTPETMRKLLLYIETDRNGYDDANTHDFIFVSAKKTPGQPLAKTSGQSIFDRLSQALDFHIHPHLFRHKWQEVFEVQAKKQGYTDEQINDMRKTACGWSESSDMVRVYNEFRNAVLVQEMSKIRQSEFMPKIDHSSKERVNEE